MLAFHELLSDGLAPPLWNSATLLHEIGPSAMKIVHEYVWLPCSSKLLLLPASLIILLLSWSKLLWMLNGRFGLSCGKHKQNQPKNQSYYSGLKICFWLHYSTSRCHAFRQNAPPVIEQLTHSSCADHGVQVMSLECWNQLQGPW